MNVCPFSALRIQNKTNYNKESVNQNTFSNLINFNTNHMTFVDCASLVCDSESLNSEIDLF